MNNFILTKIYKLLSPKTIMKSGVTFAVIFLMIAFLPIILADEQSQVQNAYNCVLNKTALAGCNSLSGEEKVFTFLSTGNCKESLLNSSNGVCFIKDGSCDLKFTSQAVIALKIKNNNVSNYTSWILNQTGISNNLEWFLQVDSPAAVNCTINNYNVTFNINKKLSSSQTSSCFSITSDKYWVKISSSCYSQEINISCNFQFSTTLFFKKTGSSTINLYDKTKTSSSGGIIKEKIKSSCFNVLGSCNYEASLWASVAIDLLDKDTSYYIPYLVAFSDGNLKYLPSSFISHLTNNDVFSNSLLSMQNSLGYWNVSDDIYYDSALALLFFSANLSEKQLAKNWLLGVQNSNGCWNNQSANSLRDTAFLLYSIWPGYSPQPPIETCGNGFIDSGEECDGIKLKGNTCGDIVENSTGNLSCYPPGNAHECQFDSSLCVGGTPECTSNEDCSGNLTCSAAGQCVNSSTSPIECSVNSDCGTNEECVNGFCAEKSKPGCEENNYFCISKSACFKIDGNQLNDYACGNSLVYCCDRNEFSCSDSNGQVCSSTEVCMGIIKGDNCCIDGDCVEESSQNLCSDNSGTCKTSCSSNEESSQYSCDSADEVCCIKTTTGGTNKNIWIIALIIIVLIAIVLLLIKFKDKIFKKKSSEKSSGFGVPRMPPRGPPGNFMPRQQIQRRAIAQRSSTPPQRVAPKKEANEDIFKKLREIGK
jgi:hypothetical protein